MALYQHAVDAVPIKVRPTTLFTGQFYINTLKSTWLQLKLAIVNLANAENRYCCCVVLRLLAFLELFKSILAVKPSVCTHDSVCAQMAAAQSSYYDAVVHEMLIPKPASWACLAYHWSLQTALKMCSHRASNQKAWGGSRSRSTACWLAKACLLLPPPPVLLFFFSSFLLCFCFCFRNLNGCRQRALVQQWRV